MLRLLTFLFLLSFCSGFAQEKKTPVAKLGWRNGDTLNGVILPSEGDKLIWKSDAFTGPFRLDPTQLKTIEFPKTYLGKNQEQNSQFRITFSNGDRLFGELIEIGPDTVTFQSPRLSEKIVVKRSFLDRIERMNDTDLKYSGPTELDTWKELGRSEKDPEYWFQQNTGEFATHRWGGELFRSIDLPAKAEISFSIICPGERPNIEIGVTEDPNTGPRIETWDDTLVLTSESRFSPILTMTDKINQLDLRLFWDQDGKSLKVCNANGEMLAQLDDVPFLPKKRKYPKTSRRSPNQRDPGEIGFRLLNRTAGVRLARLVVREWDGETIAQYDASRPRIELDGGNILFDLNDLKLQPGSGLQIKGKQLPLSRVEQLVFSTADRKSPTSPLSRLAWYDGGIITGSLAAIDHKSVKVHPVWLEKEFTAGLVNAKKLHFPESEEPVIYPGDTIKSGSLDIGGALTPGSRGNSSSLLSWRPIGSENASPLAEGRKVEIIREAYPGATEVVGDARIYLTNDEVIAGKLISIINDEVEFTSYLTGPVKIPYDKVRAVDIEGAGLIPNGFVDKGWEILAPSEDEEIVDELPENHHGELDEDEEENDQEPVKDVTMDDEKVVLRKGGFGHMNLLVGDRIKFHTRWESNYGVFTLRLFCSDFSKESPSTDLLIGAQGSRILVGQLKPGGGFNFNGQQISIKDQEADIEIMARHDKIEVSVNGKSSLTMDVKPEQVSGNGIVILTGGGWRGWNDNPNNIEFTNFSVDRSPGFLPKRIINPEAKKHALTIPRFHREDPPSHVLVASNGDLLRGKLISASGEQIVFESRDSRIELPKTRVAAIVWLLPVPEEGEKPEEKSKSRSSDFMVTHQFVLHDGTRLNLAAEDIIEEDEMFVGRSEILGICKIPIQSMQKVKQGPAHRLGRASSSDQLAYSDWVMKNTPDPAIPKGDGSEASPMIGKPAPDFTLPLLNGGEFKLSSRKGRVVVLDFWATWCGPCIRAMPEVFRAMSAFKGQPVDFCAVNQAETAPIINEFLENRGWTGTTVGLDFQLSTGRDYEVKGIPHTVVIGKDGKIAWVHTGNSPDLNKKLIQAVARALQKK